MWNVRSCYFGDKEFAQAGETRKVKNEISFFDLTITYFYIMIFAVTMGHSMLSQMEKLLTVLMSRILSPWLLRVN